MSPIRLTNAPLDARDAESTVCTPERGAVSTFQGVVRDHHQGRRVTRIEYTAYAPMTEEIFRSISAEATTRFGVGAVAIHHRLGDLAVGDVSLVVAVGSVHRREAIEACHWAVDEIKKRAPIWKKEFGDGGAFWIEGPGECAAEPGRQGDGNG